MTHGNQQGGFPLFREGFSPEVKHYPVEITIRGNGVSVQRKRC